LKDEVIRQLSTISTYLLDVLQGCSEDVPGNVADMSWGKDGVDGLLAGTCAARVLLQRDPHRCNVLYGEYVWGMALYVVT
jgi:hypothetical protein